MRLTTNEQQKQSKLVKKFIKTLFEDIFRFQLCEHNGNFFNIYKPLTK